MPRRRPGRPGRRRGGVPALLRRRDVGHFGEEEEGDAVDGRGGPLWGTESEDLNATLLAWPAGSGPPEHVNDELDVLVVVLDGSAVVALDGEERRLGRGLGAEPQDQAGPDGIRYLTVHRRRPPLQIRALLATPPEHE